MQIKHNLTISVNQNKFLPPSSPPLPPLLLPLFSGHHFLATFTFCSVHCSRGSSQHTSLDSSQQVCCGTEVHFCWGSSQHFSTGTWEQLSTGLERHFRTGLSRQLV